MTASLPTTPLSLVTRWQPRLLLAAALLFGSEVLAWTNPAGRTVVEWALLVPGYVAVSALLLDWLVRYRLRDIFGLLVLTGIYSLLWAVVLNPESALEDVPRTLFTRVMGAQALIAAEMMGLFLILSGGGWVRRLVTGAVIVGLAWGIWVRGWPVEAGYAAVPLETMLVYGAGGVGLLALVVYGLRRGDGQAGMAIERLRLTPMGWLVVALTLGISGGGRWLSGTVDGTGAILCGLLAALCWAILWFRGRKKGNTLLDGRLPVRGLPVGQAVGAVLIFGAAAIVGYQVPMVAIGGLQPHRLIGLGFTAYGLAWLPTVSLILGVQGYLRQLAARKL